MGAGDIASLLLLFKKLLFKVFQTMRAFAAGLPVLRIEFLEILLYPGPVCNIRKRWWRILRDRDSSLGAEKTGRPRRPHVANYGFGLPGFSGSGLSDNRESGKP